MANASTKKLEEKKLKLFKHLKEHEVVEKLHERNIKFTCYSETNVLQNLLYIKIDGMQGLPAVFFDNAQKDFEEVGLEIYEILNNEPLHNIFHYMLNIYD